MPPVNDKRSLKIKMKGFSLRGQDTCAAQNRSGARCPFSMLDSGLSKERSADTAPNLERLRESRLQELTQLSSGFKLRNRVQFLECRGECV